MFEVTMTEKKNVNFTPIVGDYVIIQGCSVGCHATLEGYVVDRVWVDESRHIKYNLLTVLNTLKQERFTVKHTISLDSDAPEGAVNRFF
jgi:hypothetical protein